MATYTLVGPDSKAEINATTLQSPTNGVWIMGRMAVINQNETDIAIANELLKGISVSTEPQATSAPTNYPIFDTTVLAARLWDDFKAFPSSKQSSFWAAYSAMVPLNQPLPQMMSSLDSFSSLGVSRMVRPLSTCGGLRPCAINICGGFIRSING